MAEDHDDPHDGRVTVVLPRESAVGRPAIHTEPWAKITVVMEEHHVLYLDLVSLCIRARNPGRAVSRAELVRAFIEFMEQSDIDFKQFSSAEEITEYLVPLFIGNRKPRTPMPLLESGLFSSTRAPKGHVLMAGRRREINVAASEEN